MQTMRQFVRNHRIRAEATWTDPDPETYERWPHTAYKVVLRRGSKQMTVPSFEMGITHTHEPTAEEVLSNLASSAGTYENSNGFEDWASEYGLETDEEDEEAKHRFTYGLIRGEAGSLLRFLGCDLYEELLYKTNGL